MAARHPRQVPTPAAPAAAPAMRADGEGACIRRARASALVAHVCARRKLSRRLPIAQRDTSLSVFQILSVSFRVSQCLSQSLSVSFRISQCLSGSLSVSQNLSVSLAMALNVIGFIFYFVCEQVQMVHSMLLRHIIFVLAFVTLPGAPGSITFDDTLCLPLSMSVCLCLCLSTCVCMPVYLCVCLPVSVFMCRTPAPELLLILGSGEF